MSARMIDGPQCRLNTRVDGAEGAPWIVLSNSLGATMEMWEPQMPLLTQHYRVLRYDTRGHGGSETAPGAFGFTELVADLVAVMDAHGVGRADVMGLSLGGMTGLGLALNHPDRVHRLVCADARADATEMFRQNFAGRAAKVREGGLEAVLDQTIDMWFTPEFIAANPETVAHVRAMVMSNDPAGYVATCEALPTLDYLKDLGRIEAEVLYIVGDADKGAPPDTMRDMAERTPRGRFVEIASAGHVANVNQPAAYDAALVEFFGLKS